MKKDFHDRAELESFVEFRLLPNIDLYARSLVELGDVFVADPVGLYHPQTGECIVNFDRPGFYIDRKSRKRKPLANFEDVETVSGDIYDYDGRMIMQYQRFTRVELLDERPIHIKARESAIAMVGEILDEFFDYSRLAREIERPQDLMDLEAIHSSARRDHIYSTLRWDIIRDLEQKLNGYEWHEIWLYKQHGTAVIDVQLDIRIKKYHLDILEEKERNLESDTIEMVSGVSRREPDRTESDSGSSRVSRYRRRA